MKPETIVPAGDGHEQGMPMGAADAGAAHRAQAADRKDAACEAFDPSDWAWEFLRRNPHYAAAWRASAPRRLPIVTLADGTLLLRLRRRYPLAEHWGLYVLADPSRRARDVPVFWLPTIARRTIRAGCRIAASPTIAGAFTLARFTAARSAVIGVDGIPVVSLKGDGVSVGLAARGWHVLTRPAAITFELDAFDDIGAQAECIKLLQRFSEVDDLRKIGRSPWASDERLRHTLTALDGKSYREIAIMIFGEERVIEDWNGASRFMKDRVRRLVAKGHDLMDGGYRELLR
ncbi:MAG: DUF2285 domain-containing protein [Rhizobiales bacterium]|nr:DUF2285 domain-containing protein [Hyphomicrobiales bacterium]